MDEQKIFNDQIFSFIENLITRKENNQFFKEDAKKYLDLLKQSKKIHGSEKNNVRCLCYSGKNNTDFLHIFDPYSDEEINLKDDYDITELIQNNTKIDENNTKIDENESQKGGQVTTKNKKTIKCPNFIIFAGDTYYPDGGWNDFYSFADTKNEAHKIYEEILKKREDNWSHVLDFNSGKIIYDSWPHVKNQIGGSCLQSNRLRELASLENDIDSDSLINYLDGFNNNQKGGYKKRVSFEKNIIDVNDETPLTISKKEKLESKLKYAWAEQIKDLGKQLGIKPERGKKNLSKAYVTKRILATPKFYNDALKILHKSSMTNSDTESESN